MKLTITKILIVVFLLVGASVFIPSISKKLTYYSLTIVRADDDKEDDNEIEKEEKDDGDKLQVKPVQTSETVEIPQNVTNIPATDQKPVVRNITLVDPGFDKDTDGDGIVDALDPNPQIPEKVFYTDSDNDGVADAFDIYEGEDDFLYTEFMDTNSNGILDSLEQ